MLFVQALLLTMITSFILIFFFKNKLLKSYFVIRTIILFLILLSLLLDRYDLYSHNYNIKGSILSVCKSNKEIFFIRIIDGKKYLAKFDLTNDSNSKDIIEIDVNSEMIKRFNDFLFIKSSNIISCYTINGELCNEIKMNDEYSDYFILSNDKYTFYNSKEQSLIIINKSNVERTIRNINFINYEEGNLLISQKNKNNIILISDKKDNEIFLELNPEKISKTGDNIYFYNKNKIYEYDFNNKKSKKLSFRKFKDINSFKVLENSRIIITQTIEKINIYCYLLHLGHKEYQQEVSDQTNFNMNNILIICKEKSIHPLNIYLWNENNINLLIFASD